jgi:hypothetical protein
MRVAIRFIANLLKHLKTLVALYKNKLVYNLTTFTFLTFWDPNKFSDFCALIVFWYWKSNCRTNQFYSSRLKQVKGPLNIEMKMIVQVKERANVNYTPKKQSTQYRHVPLLLHKMAVRALNRKILSSFHRSSYWWDFNETLHEWPSIVFGNMFLWQKPF